MALTPTPGRTPAPETPQRLVDDSEEYVAKVDPWMDWLPTATEEVEGMATAAELNAQWSEQQATSAQAAKDAAIAATTLVREVANNISISAGAKNLTGLNAPVAATFANGDEVYIIRRSNRAARMWGVVSGANMGAGTMTVTIAAGAFYNGGGPYNDWVVMHAAFVEIEFRPPVVLAPGATVTPDFSFENHILTANQAFALAIPTNLHAGKSGVITIKQDATGGRLWTPDPAYTFPGGAPALSTAPNAVDAFAYYVEDAATPVLRCVMSQAFGP